METIIKAAFQKALVQVFQESEHGALVPAAGKEPTGSAVMALVGLSGDLQGFLCLFMPPASLEAWSRALAERYHVASEGESRRSFALSALGESANQVAGRFAMLAAEGGRNCGITPPTVLTGRGVDIDLPRCKESCWLEGALPFGEIQAFLGFSA